MLKDMNDYTKYLTTKVLSHHIFIDYRLRLLKKSCVGQNYDLIDNIFKLTIIPNVEVDINTYLDRNNKLIERIFRYYLMYFGEDDHFIKCIKLLQSYGHDGSINEAIYLEYKYEIIKSPYLQSYLCPFN